MSHKRTNVVMKLSVKRKKKQSSSSCHSSSRQTSLLSFLMTSKSPSEQTGTTKITGSTTTNDRGHSTPRSSSLQTRSTETRQESEFYKITPESACEKELSTKGDPQEFLEEAIVGNNNEIMTSKSPLRQKDNSRDKAQEDDKSSTVDSSNDTDDDSDTNDEPSTKKNPDGLSEYELLRLRNIERNNARLAALGLLTTKTEPCKPAVGAKSRRRKRPAPTAAISTTPMTTRRRSTRQRRPLVVGNEESGGTVHATATTLDGNDNGTTVMATNDETGVVESYTVSPLVEYAMNCDSQTPLSGRSSVQDFSTAHHPMSSLKLCRTRLAPPSRLGGIYSLQFYNPGGTNTTGIDVASSNHWIVGAGKAGVIALWDASTKSSRVDVPVNDNEEQRDDADYAAVDPILSWKAHGGRWIADARFLPHSSTTCSSSRDHNAPPSRLLTAANDGAVCLWDLTTVSAKNAIPKLLMRTGKELHASGIFALDTLCLQSDLLFATGSKDKTIQISTLGTMELGWWTSNHHSSKVGDVRFRGNGSSLLASVGDDGVVALHDFRSQRIVGESTQAHVRPHSIAWDPGQEHVFLTAGHDKTIKLWDLRKFGDQSSPIGILEGHVPNHEIRCKKIHRPIFYHPHGSHSEQWNDSSFVLTGGQQSHSLSMFHARGFASLYSNNSDNGNSMVKNSTIDVSMSSRGKLPEGSEDGVCIAVDGSRVAVSTDLAEVLLLEPNWESASANKGDEILL